MAGRPSSSNSNGVGSAPFSIEVARRDASLVVSISGEFDLAATERFGQVLKELSQGGLSDVEIDLRPVSFIDSTGLRMLVEAERIARERELPLRIVRGSSSVQKVFQLTGLDKVLPLVDG